MEGVQQICRIGARQGSLKDSVSYTCSVIGLPRGSIVVHFCGSYIESYKVIPKKELLWSL